MMLFVFRKGAFVKYQMRETIFMTMRATLRLATAARRGMPVYFSPDYVHELPPRHPFPMERYLAVQAALRPRPAVQAGLLEVRAVPAVAQKEEILLAHCADYYENYIYNRLDTAAMRAIGFPWTPGFVQRTVAIVGGTLAAVRDVLVDGCAAAANAAGGTHHAFSDHGEGYCIFNDLAVAAKLALEQDWAQRVLVIDLDVHQGNGTAQILHGDRRTFTLSLHGERNYPWRTRYPSDLDVGLDDRIDGRVYMPALEHALQVVTDIFVRPARDAGHKILCLYQAGVDPLKGDRWGRLALSHEDLAARNLRVYDYCREWGLSVAVTMGGGYAKPVTASAEAHADVFCQAAEFDWNDRKAAA